MGLQDFDEEMQDHALGVSPYGYSAVKIGQKLTAPEYTLATIVVDDSGSVDPFRPGLEKLISTIVETLRFSPRADYLMIRVVRFGTQMKEIHGFKLLDDINLIDYNGCLGDGGGTYLFGACKNALEATYDYAKQLFDNQYKVNGLVFVLTDGDDTCSHRDNINPSDVKTALKRFTLLEDMVDEFGERRKVKVMESLVSILVGVNIQDPTIKSYLDKFAKAAGFDHHLAMEDASEETLKRIAGFGSQSISLTSQAIGSGGPSQKIKDLVI